jgi:hypothetical protein
LVGRPGRQEKDEADGRKVERIRDFLVANEERPAGEGRPPQRAFLLETSAATAVEAVTTVKAVTAIEAVTAVEAREAIKAVTTVKACTAVETASPGEPTELVGF